MKSGTRVIDRGWKRIQKEMKEIHGSYVKIGVISGGGEKRYKKHKDVSGKKEGSNVDIARLAAIHEYGLPSKRIPSRPFIKQSFDKNKRKIKSKTESLLKNIYQGSKTTKGALDTLGLFHQGNTRKIFTEGSFRANKPSTVKEKGSSRPLIDTGRLRQSIDYEVVIK